jgi:hypothetical protein
MISNMKREECNTAKKYPTAVDMLTKIHDRRRIKLDRCADPLYTK